MEDETYEKVDLIIVGAGPSGLVCARTYLTINPSANVVILESAATIGGVWAKERIYPGLHLNNLLGTYEYSDFPMSEKKFGVTRGKHIPGEAAHEYLKAYAQEFGFYSKIRFESKVESVEKIDSNDQERWTVAYCKTNSASGNVVRYILTKKLVLSTGTCEEPVLPVLKDSETFDAPLFHSRDMAKEQHAIREAKNVAVLGGSKSGYDAAYLAASNGAQVDWIISNSGRGGIWISPPYVTPFKKWLEKFVTTRIFTWFSPCSWGDADGFGRIRELLHRTSIGRWVVDKFWRFMGDDVIKINRYDDHPETKKLKPWTETFWISTSFSILNYPTDFYDLVRNGQIRVHVGDVEKLSPKTIHLKGGEVIKTDLLISCTGWKGFPNIQFLPKGIEKKLGIPFKSTKPEKLTLLADIETFSHFPRLKEQPTVKNPYNGVFEDRSKNNNYERFKLYRLMVPPAFIHDRSIGFVGMLTTFSTLLSSQVQALWMTAYLDGKLDLETSPGTTEKEFLWDATLHNQFLKWRYPFASPVHPDFVFDTVPYLDWILHDLKLKSHRKRGILAEIFQPYGPEDYRGLIEEWKTLHKKETAQSEAWP
ncbi:hypothetical protein LOZ39_002576 [Ophidiomyces ophidiicola]|nr:hypothetical protein LOZ61_003378 [Ophidiomyces ophidiicola]KAI1920259.1 hypothetical protein LOZ64_001885 [Ophidiomyces ophidiicola]KAI1924111.1 hypothetical protein LOZ60_004869 [Ophidiomyces ophidiicola]KAI1960022.1 hypothetical protein LOZ59_002970 [Ophidiomyces ophidiicola]KAI2006232.1 hypothetical protein LOZ49_005128 [Ophidiomyces ophidiicola]